MTSSCSTHPNVTPELQYELTWQLKKQIGNTVFSRWHPVQPLLSWLLSDGSQLVRSTNGLELRSDYSNFFWLINISNTFFADWLTFKIADTIAGVGCGVGMRGIGVGMWGILGWGWWVVVVVVKTACKLVKNAYELVNIGALKFSSTNYTSFNVWVTYSVWNFKGYLWNSTQNILPIHWMIRFLFNIENLRVLRFTSSYTFLNTPTPRIFRAIKSASYLNVRGPS